MRVTCLGYDNRGCGAMRKSGGRCRACDNRKRRDARTASRMGISSATYRQYVVGNPQRKLTGHWAWHCQKQWESATPKRGSNPYDPQARPSWQYWTLGQVVSANKDAGGHFFDRATLRGFGETLKSFTTKYEGDNVYVVRKHDGKKWRFDPATGHIGPSTGANPAAWFPANPGKPSERWRYRAARALDITGRAVSALPGSNIQRIRDSIAADLDAGKVPHMTQVCMLEGVARCARQHWRDNARNPRKRRAKAKRGSYAAFIRAQWKTHRAAFKRIGFKAASKRLALAWKRTHK